jgi:hypothetical protein
MKILSKAAIEMLDDAVRNNERNGAGGILHNYCNDGDSTAHREAGIQLRRRFNFEIRNITSLYQYTGRYYQSMWVPSDQAEKILTEARNTKWWGKR